MPGCVITLPKTVSPKTASERLDLSFGIFARRGEKYSCYYGYMRTGIILFFACISDICNLINGISISFYNRYSLSLSHPIPLSTLSD
ncbi:hypothetical protein NM96_05150 [Neisseria mucosa]|nr:hypothetical protein NM96_05150 [Neisseria mucosa]